MRNDKENEQIDEQPDESVRTIWENKTVDVTIDKPMNEVKALFLQNRIPSQKYGFGGKWTKDGKHYLSLGGHVSRNGLPMKASIGGDIIPISSTDVKNLEKLGFMATKNIVFE